MIAHKIDKYRRNAWHYAPGATKDTPIEHIEAGIAGMCPLGRVGLTQDIARVVAFLASKDSEWINGMPCFYLHMCSQILMTVFQPKLSNSVVAAWHRRGSVEVS